MPPTPCKSTLDPTTVDLVTRMLQQKGLGWVRLYTLFVVNECGKLYRAAPLLGLGGVHAVRNRIRTLEEELDLILIVSDATGSSITAVGRAVIDLIRPEFAAID